MEKTKNKFRMSREARKLEPLKIEDSSFNEKFDHNLEDVVVDFSDDKKTEEYNSDVAIKKHNKPASAASENNEFGSEMAIVAEGQDSSLKSPYQFIGVSKPPLHTIILPHFSFKSINFALSVLMLVMFISLFVVHEVRPKTPKSWGCLLFQAQNKFYPRLKEEYQLWRVVVSGLFHSNFSHLILNLIGLQLYGYFVEWYIGRWRYCLVVALAMINAHFLSCLTNMFTVSTTASGILYAMLAVKVLFFVKYAKYEPLDSKRLALYGLIGLIFGMNIIVLFVGGNVDIGGHVGGLVTGLVMGGVFYEFEEQSRWTKALRYGLIGVMALLTVGLIGVAFGLQSEAVSNLNLLVDDLC